VTSAGPLIAGANRSGFHLSGVTYGRDYLANMTGDIAQAREGHLCPRCRQETLSSRRGIELGHTFKLGTVYTVPLGATIVAEDGSGGHPVIMASYGIGLTRLLACLIEEHHDTDGIIWPASVAPYTYHLLVAGSPTPEVRSKAEGLYRKLGETVTLYDDRDVSTGVKLKDADLLGMPIRVTVSERSLAAGGAELRLRGSGRTSVAPLAEVKRQATILLHD
jgi:prolyl-tRNA synthetase